MAFHKAAFCSTVFQHISCTNDHPVHPNTRSLLYADDLCFATQKKSFEEVVWHGKLFAYCYKPVYLGVTLDRCLTYKNHIAKIKAKTGAMNSILKKWRTPTGEQTPGVSAPQPWLCVSPLLSMRPQSGADHRMLQRPTSSRTLPIEPSPDACDQPG